MLHRQNIFHVLWHLLNFFCFKVQKSFWRRPTTKPWKMSRYFPKNWSLLLVLCCRSFWTQHLDFEKISFRPPTCVSIQTVSQKWLISAKKKSLFRSLCSTFNDLEKFNELKTHTYMIFFISFFFKFIHPLWNSLAQKQYGIDWGRNSLKQLLNHFDTIQQTCHFQFQWFYKNVDL